MTRLQKERARTPDFQSKSPYWPTGKSHIHLLEWLSQKNRYTLFSITSGGEAEPSPPYGRIAQDTPSLNRHPYQLRYGAGLARQTFVPRLYLRQRARLLRTSPQSLVSPPRWWLAPRPRQRQFPHHRHSSIGWNGHSVRRHCARQTACRFLHRSIGTVLSMKFKYWNFV